MEDNILFSCDTSEFKAMTARLTGKEMKRAQRRALQKGSSILVKQTRKEMKQAGFKFRKGMEKGVVSRVHRSGNKSTIHLFGDHSLTNKDRGIIRYLEMGTRERYRSTKYVYRKGNRIAKSIPGRKKGYSGKIKGYHFFRKANETYERNIENAIESTIENEIRKMNNLK